MEDLSKGRVLVDFWAPWCQPCKYQKVNVERFGQEVDEVEVVMVNIDEDPDTPSKYGIRSIPTMLYMEDGIVKATKIGITTVSQLKEMCEVSE